MPKAYLIGLTWTDNSEPDNFHHKSAQLLNRYHGRYLVIGGCPSAVQGKEAPNAALVLEFPNREAAKSFYNDPEYASLRIVGEQLQSDLSVVLADGVD